MIWRCLQQAESSKVRVVCLQFGARAGARCLLLDWKVFCYKFNFSIIFILWATRAAEQGRAEWDNNNMNNNNEDGISSSITQIRIH